MKKLRLIIYILLFAFNIALFLFAVYMDTYDDMLELGILILPKIPYMKYGALLGVILVAVDFIIDKVEKKTLIKEVEKTKNELNAVKAQLFDSQQPKTTSPNDANSDEVSDAPKTASED